jgi:hypothetical protein
METNPAPTPDAMSFAETEGASSNAAPAAGITALSTSTAPATPAAPADTSYESALRKIGSSTKTYTDQMSALLKTMTPTAEEKESRSAERKGVMALKAAQALLQPGTNAAGARGTALGQIAELTQAYGKEDREDKKAMIGAEINMLGAQAQLAQGNSKMAVDMFQHAEKLAAEATRFEAEKLFKQRELDLKEKGLWNEKTQGEEIIKMRKYIADQEAAWRKQHIGVLAGQGRRDDLRHDAAMERSRVAERGQDLRAYASLLETQLKNGMYANPAEKKAMQTQLADLTKQLRSSLGMPDTAPAPSIQIPDSRVNPRDIIE